MQEIGLCRSGVGIKTYYDHTFYHMHSNASPHVGDRFYLFLQNNQTSPTILACTSYVLQQAQVDKQKYGRRPALPIDSPPLDGWMLKAFVAAVGLCAAILSVALSWKPLTVR